jgi:hypothetical protein
MTDGSSDVPGTTASRPSGGGLSYTGDDEPRGYSWVVFAGIMIMIAGTLNLIYGIAAISNSHFYISEAHYVISELNTWGWVLTVIGVIQFCVALGIWMQAAWARWTGVAIASLNAIVQLIFIAGYPFLSLSIFALDLLVIYGLVTYGGRSETA